MRRVGKYTKNSKIRSAKLTANKYVLWFKNLKAWQKVAVIVGPIAIIMVIVPLITYVPHNTLFRKIFVRSSVFAEWTEPAFQP